MHHVCLLTDAAVFLEMEKKNGALPLEMAYCSPVDERHVHLFAWATHVHLLHRQVYLEGFE